MAYYYVKNGGTATGDAGRYASQQTGSFAALGVGGYYPDLAASIAATTSPVAGDFILVSDLHSSAISTNRTITGLIPNVFFVVCVDDANIDAARTSGNRGVENGGILTMSGALFSGMEFSSGNGLTWTSSNYLKDCLLRVTTNNDSVVTASGDGSIFTATNTEFHTNNITQRMTVNNAASIIVSGGSVSTTSAGLTNLFNGGFTGGGGVVLFSGVDISAVAGTIIGLIGADAGADDMVDVRMDLCKIATGVAFTSETFKSYNQRALFTRCSDTSATAEYQYHLHAFGGDVDDDATIYRNEDEPFTESNQKISYKVVTNSDASLGSPLWLDFPMSRYSELSAGATDVLSFYITSATALTDKDIYIEVSYPDGTNKQTPNFISTGPLTVGGTIDLMATGTTLTTDATSTWTGALANLYQIDVSTAGDPGADCQPTVKVYITKPSTTFYIASEYGLS